MLYVLVVILLFQLVLLHAKKTEHGTTVPSTLQDARSKPMGGVQDQTYKHCFCAQKHWDHTQAAADCHIVEQC